MATKPPTTAALKVLLQRSRYMLATLILSSATAQPGPTDDKWVSQLILDIDKALKG